MRVRPVDPPLRRPRLKRAEHRGRQRIDQFVEDLGAASAGGERAQLLALRNG